MKKTLLISTQRDNIGSVLKCSGCYSMGTGILFKNIATISLALIFICFSFPSCQKSKPQEAKKEVQTQKEEIKQPQTNEPKAEDQLKQQAEKAISQEPKEEKKEISLTKEPSPLTEEEQKEIKEKSPQSASQEKEARFKEPVLLWEKEFDPPIREISDQNSNGEFLAIQVEEEKESGRTLSQKILVIDSQGKTKREEALLSKKKTMVPADQLWLTATSEEEFHQLKEAKKPQKVEAWGREMFISGNGEYYAILMQYGNWYEFEYKDKEGKTLWKINPKDNYGFWSAYISYDGSRIVIIDMGGLGGGDEWEVMGQRIYFYDRTGKLLKDYDFKEKDEEWINTQEVSLSADGRFIAATRGQNNILDHSVILFGDKGQILWEKTFFEQGRHSVWIVPGLSGEIAVYSGETEYIVNSKGETRWVIRRNPATLIRGTNDPEEGRLVYVLVDKYANIEKPINFKSTNTKSIYVFQYETGKKIADMDNFVSKIWWGGLDISDDNRFIVGNSLFHIELFDKKLHKLWQKEFIQTPYTFLSGNLLKIMLDSSRKAKKIYIYDLSKHGRKQL